MLITYKALYQKCEISLCQSISEIEIILALENQKPE